ncbi:MAG: hypothetical protein ACO31K_05965 [Schleiferiaceae bacterium]
MSAPQPPRPIVRTFPQPAQPADADGAVAAAGAGVLGAPAFRYLAAGEGKKQWTGCKTDATPLDSGKKYGFYKPADQLVTDLLKTNNVVLTADLQQFVDTCSDTVRVSDCPDFPAQQGKYVVRDILLHVRGMEYQTSCTRYIERNIVGARDAMGNLFYPSIGYVSNSNPAGGTVAVVDSHDAYTLLKHNVSALRDIPDAPPRHFAYLAAGEGKKQWTGCKTAERPQDSGKKYGFHKPVYQLVAGMLEDNGVALTPGLQEFVDTRSGTVRVSDCKDFPAQQGKYVLYDVLLGAGIVDLPTNLPRFFERNIEDARNPSGGLLYPSLMHVPSGNPRVSFPSFPNLRGNHFNLQPPDFACFWY